MTIFSVGKYVIQENFLKIDRTFFSNWIAKIRFDYAKTTI
ncbi:hypothetical protein HMPREF0621_1096 [Pasteurella dagmatis ATCC 43325]|uniref:Uncharacterized protein n=1 Tax=Pasteurella dagmatis ATCC 43325 TaxID=667128 RepID=C9PQ22_9PAST|nr:hypothetical protein HMPREF0621_1096 [Pasteurella dagmatis ATCC 43325]